MLCRTVLNNTSQENQNDNQRGTVVIGKKLLKNKLNFKVIDSIHIKLS